MKWPMKWVECPRDSWQGFKGFVPTDRKVAYLKRLLDAGFTHLDLTSFVSPKWVPQHADAEEVLAQLPPPEGRDYLAVIANEKGLERALHAPNVTSVGYPFSVSETFQRKNLNASIEDSWAVVERMADQAAGKRFVVYLSMAFGNPYGDSWEPELTAQFAHRIGEVGGVAGIVLADTYGVATAEVIGQTLRAVAEYNAHSGLDQTIGVHLHSRPEQTLEKVRVVLDAGVGWLEGALGGIGGCPFAGDDLVGNLGTELVLPYLKERGFDLGVRAEALAELSAEAAQLKAQYADLG